MITGERGQRATVMMVGEVDRRETADAVERFCRILEAAKMRREPVLGSQ